MSSFIQNVHTSRNAIAIAEIILKQGNSQLIVHKLCHDYISRDYNFTKNPRTVFYCLPLNVFGAQLKVSNFAVECTPIIIYEYMGIE